jgi:DNA repair photolyase
LMSPIVPGFSSRPALIERTIEACAQEGLAVVGANVMHLEEGARTHFLAWLASTHPELVDGYADLYRRKTAPAAYRAEVARVVASARDRHPPTTRPRQLPDRPTTPPLPAPRPPHRS